jgi:hypothetical protein
MKWLADHEYLATWATLVLTAAPFVFAAFKKNQNPDIAYYVRQKKVHSVDIRPILKKSASRIRKAWLSEFAITLPC